MTNFLQLQSEKKENVEMILEKKHIRSQWRQLSIQWLSISSRYVCFNDFFRLLFECFYLFSFFPIYLLWYLHQKRCNRYNFITYMLWLMTIRLDFHDCFCLSIGFTLHFGIHWYILLKEMFYVTIFAI